ncbi:hypothetical protein LCGC14_1981810 [marine sediment metagenome]|uniref:Nuclease associated modular domain-containing protein n=1 Tax=marine sediment metagenome TaxID=412755 RepID=A0A0F9HLX3_9ZZZZ
MAFIKGHKHSDETKKKIGLANKGEWVSFECDYCGGRSKSQASKYKRKKRHFCSNKCYARYRKEILPKEEQNRYGTGESIEEKIKKLKCRSNFNHYLRDKKIKRMPCIVCGSLKSEGHHFNYSKPLEVTWLCFKHHRQIHKQSIEQADFPEWLTLYENPELVEE